MKKVLFITILSIVFGCSKSEEVENLNPHNLLELGLTPNNIYPFWPDTSQFLGSNQWYDSKNGDTLKIFRRDMVTDDSGDEIEYRFLIKPNQWIVPLNIKRVRYEATIDVDSLGNPIVNPNNGLMYNKPLVNFSLQKYEEGKVLACEVTTPNGDYYLQNPLIDRMWIKLDD